MRVITSRAQLHVDRVAVGRRVDRRLLEVPLRVREVGAPLSTCALAAASGARAAATVACSPLTGARCFCVALRLVGAAVAELALQFLDVGLGLLQRKAVAGAGGHQFAVLPHPPLAPGRAAARSARDLPAGRLQLLLQLPRAGRSVDRAGARLLELGLVGCRAGPRRTFSDLVGRRVDSEQHIALLHQPVRLDRHLDHPAAHLRDDLHRVLDHPHVGATTARPR